jgi:hypothetical protein
MRVRVGLVPLFLIASLVLAYPATATAAAIPPAASSAVLGAGEGPAVESEPAEEEEEEQPWTARYLAPTTLLLGLLALGGSVLYYGVRIRGRYKVAP